MMAKGSLLLLTFIWLVKVLLAQQCMEHQFSMPFVPGTSCEDIYNKNIQSRNASGYYWILDGPARVYCGMNYTGVSCENIYLSNEATRDKPGYYRIVSNTTNSWVLCDMNAVAIAYSRRDLISSCAGVDGVWRRIASFDVATGDDCPSPWIKGSYNSANYCLPAITTGGCYSVFYSTNGMPYQRVCGGGSVFPKDTPDGFWAFNNGVGIDSFYVDGMSITHGNPRQHIWTYAFPCAYNIPTFVGLHYYCESIIPIH